MKSKLAEQDLVNLPYRCNPIDCRTQRSEFAVQLLVAAVQVMNFLHNRLAFRSQAGQDQRGAGAKVRGDDAGTVEAAHSPDHCGAPVHLDSRSQPVQLGHLHKPAGEHPVPHNAPP